MFPLSDSERKRWMDFAYGEYVRRRENGEWIEIDEYCQLFPQISHSLRELISADHFLRVRLDFLGSALPEDWPQASEHFLGYQLLRELGQGGFSRVYLALDATGQPVVAKVTEDGDQEALILQQFQHPNIIEVLNVKQCLRRNAEFTAIIMPYHGCTTLHDILSQRRKQSTSPYKAEWLLETVAQHEEQWTAIDHVEKKKIQQPEGVNNSFTSGDSWEHCVAKLGAEIADALHYVHQKGLLHRDIKPANVLITTEGKPILLDFNLAWKIADFDESIGGTMPYMAPEQLTVLQYEVTQGKKGEIRCGDARSEICSLGIVLFELFTGIHPYYQKDVPSVDREQLRSLHGSQMQSMTRLAEGASEEFQAILNRCLARNPYHRYASASELAQALRELTEPKKPRLLHTRKRWLGLAASVAAVLILICTLMLISSDSPTIRTYTPGELHYLKGRELARKRRPTEALKHYEQAQEYVYHRNIHARMGACLIQSGRFHPALQYHQNAIDAGLKNSAILNNHGYALLQIGSLNQAKTLFTEAIQLDPESMLPHLHRANVDLKQAQKDSKYVPRQGIKDIEVVLASKKYRHRANRIAFQLFHVMSQREPMRADYWRKRMRQLMQKHPHCIEKRTRSNHFTALLDPVPNEKP